MSGVLAHLFAAPVVFLAALVVAVGDLSWLLATADLAGALTTVLVSPGATLALLGALLGSTVVHELGHAAACTAGGGRPGRIGVGLYVVYLHSSPTSPTPIASTGRPGCAPTSAGYFNALTIVALTGRHAVTGHPIALVALLLVHLEAIQQLLPLGRLDGDFVLADLAGVPDLFGRIGPILRSAVPGRPTAPKVAQLRPAARRWVIAWVGSCVPVMVGRPRAGPLARAGHGRPGLARPRPGMGPPRGGHRLGRVGQRGARDPLPAPAPAPPPRAGLARHDALRRLAQLSRRPHRTPRTRPATRGPTRGPTCGPTRGPTCGPTRGPTQEGT